MSNINKFFDYNSLPDNATRATLRKEATAIKLAVKRTHDNIIEIGNRLLHAKEVAGHGKFAEWIEAEFQMSDRHARNFMNVAETFGKSEIISDLSISNTALFMLAAPSVSEETRSVALELAASGDLKTTADAKAVIEASKPITPSLKRIPWKLKDQFPDVVGPGRLSKEEDEDELGPDPFADEEPAESLADIAAIEAEDEPEEDTYFRDEEVLPPSPSETLKERVKNAEVVHDTLKANAPRPESEMSEEELFENLAIVRVLRQKQHKAIFLQRDLRGYFAIAEAKKSFDFNARRGYDIKNADNTMFARALTSWVNLPHPRDWQLCAPCKGNGCQRCGYAGYDTTGAGISPLRVESGEVTV